MTWPPTNSAGVEADRSRQVLELNSKHRALVRATDTGRAVPEMFCAARVAAPRRRRDEYRRPSIVVN
jgi:hypothetical protein